MSKVRVHTLVIVTKTGKNRMQHVRDIGMLTEEVDVIEDPTAEPVG